MQISVITPTLNAENTLDDAIGSVIGQGMGVREQIIVDGGSTDRTVDIGKGYPHVTVIRSKGNLYAALNRALELASGDIICHLNADDVIPPGTFRVVESTFVRTEVDVVTGYAVVQPLVPEGSTKAVRYDNSERATLSIQNATFGVPLINARYWRKDVYDRIGVYDPQYSIAADRDFLIRAAAARLKEIIIPEILYRYRAHSSSLTLHGSLRSYLPVANEHLRIAKSWMADERLTPEERACLRAWHSEASTQAIALAILRGDVGKSLSLARDAVTIDSNAAWRIPRFAVEKLGRWVLRKSWS